METDFHHRLPGRSFPVGRATDTKQGLTERFKLFVVGRKLANNDSELNDPEDQAERFKAHSGAKRRRRRRSDALQCTTTTARWRSVCSRLRGCGIGIDRLVMLLTDSQTIRDVILFPQMRPE